jgi:hypothetical protein
MKIRKFSWFGMCVTRACVCARVSARARVCESNYIHKEGHTWSRQLDDKIEPVATHLHWSIQTCNKDPATLQKSVINVEDHYKNNHDNCSPESRCRKDPKYEPSRKVITDPKAEKAEGSANLINNIQTSRRLHYGRKHI